MKALFPFIKLFKRQWFMMLLGLILAITTLAAGIGLLSLSGWFLSAAGVAGLTAATAQAFNFFTPAGGVRFLSIARTASRYGERLATHEATFRLLTPGADVGHHGGTPPACQQGRVIRLRQSAPARTAGRIELSYSAQYRDSPDQTC